MKTHIEPIGKLINNFSKLSGVGSKTAQRFAYEIINMSLEEVEAFSQSLLDCKTKVRFCKVCGNYTDNDTCDICKERSHETICVGKEPKDVLAMERIHEYNGVYHVLHGTLKPSMNIGVKDITVDALIERVKNESVKEVIIATNPDYDGEITAMYVSSKIKPLGVKVSRLAHGIPVGSEIEYTDEVTLGRAFIDRKEI